jgi:ribosomal protein S18 acetylase RimI-like enzyme
MLANAYVIERVQRATQELVDAFRALLPELSERRTSLSEAELDEIAAAPSNRLLVARHAESRTIVGSATVVLIRIPSGWRARLESVIVHPTARGKGIGEALCRRALQIAREEGVAAVDLTSMPSRAAANRLYGRLGFVRRDTNVYRVELSELPVERGTG